jgi:hypothetical protein
MDLRFSSVMYWGLSATRDFHHTLKFRQLFFVPLPIGAAWLLLQHVASNMLPCLFLQLLILVQDYQQPSLAGLTKSSIWEPFVIWWPKEHSKLSAMMVLVCTIFTEYWLAFTWVSTEYSCQAWWGNCFLFWMLWFNVALLQFQPK